MNVFLVAALLLHGATAEKFNVGSIVEAKDRLARRLRVRSPQQHRRKLLMNPEPEDGHDDDGDDDGGADGGADGSDDGVANDGGDREMVGEQEGEEGGAAEEIPPGDDDNDDDHGHDNDDNDDNNDDKCRNEEDECAKYAECSHLIGEISGFNDAPVPDSVFESCRSNPLCNSVLKCHMDEIIPDCVAQCNFINGNCPNDCDTSECKEDDPKLPKSHIDKYLADGCPPDDSTHDDHHDNNPSSLCGHGTVFDGQRCVVSFDHFLSSCATNPGHPMCGNQGDASCGDDTNNSPTPSNNHGGSATGDDDWDNNNSADGGNTWDNKNTAGGSDTGNNSPTPSNNHG
jgi:hypothetical protein